MTATRLAEKKQSSCFKPFDNDSDKEIVSKATDFCAIASLLHYKNVEMNGVLSSMASRLSQVDDITSPEGRDLLHSAMTDFVKLAMDKIQYLTNVLAQMDLEVKNND